MTLRTLAFFSTPAILCGTPWLMLTVLAPSSTSTGTHDAVAIFAALGAALSLLTAVGFAPIVRWWGGLAPFGALSAHQTRTVSFDGSPAEAFEAGQRAVAMLGTITASDPVCKTVEGLRAWAPLSHGERISIRVEERTSGGCTIVLQSSPLRPETKADQGSGTLNVRALAREIKTPTTHAGFPWATYPVGPRRPSTDAHITRPTA